jgi:Fe-S-cluster-containing dehydrogenase component
MPEERAADPTPPPWEALVKGKPMQRAGLVVDPRRCVGCHACAVSCKTEHDVPLGGFRIRTHYLQRPDRPTHQFLPLMCQHCQDAPCVEACKSSAVTRLEDGRVVIDEERCTGNHDCVAACPYDAIYVDPHTGKADKCDLCHGRTAAGLLPACVEACPTEALRFGDLDDLDGDVARYADAHGASSLRPEHGTRPTVQYVGLEPWMGKKAHGVQLHESDNDIVYER